jgi:carboxylesterase
MASTVASPEGKKRPLLGRLLFRARGGLDGVGDPSPRSVEGRSPTVLAFHGFGGTPQEVALVLDAARAVGLRGVAPLLPGHGTHARDLARTGFEDWAAAAQRALDAIDGPVVCAGLSLGAVLAAHLAAHHRDRVCGLAMLASAVFLTPTTSLFLELVQRLGAPDFAIPKVGSDIADAAARRTHLTYGAQPVRAALGVLAGGARVRGELHRIECPTFIAHGKNDRVCPSFSAHFVAERLGRPPARVLMLERSRHVITRDRDALELRRELEDFLVRFDT